MNSIQLTPTACYKRMYEEDAGYWAAYKQANFPNNQWFDGNTQHYYNIELPAATGVDYKKVSSIALYITPTNLSGDTFESIWVSMGMTTIANASPDNPSDGTVLIRKSNQIQPIQLDVSLPNSISEKTWYLSFRTNYTIWASVHYVIIYYEDAADKTIGYYDGTEWKQCVPYYYDGSAWKKCEASYYDGTAWR